MREPHDASDMTSEERAQILRYVSLHEEVCDTRTSHSRKIELRHELGKIRIKMGGSADNTVHDRIMRMASQIASEPSRTDSKGATDHA